LRIYSSIQRHRPQRVLTLEKMLGREMAQDFVVAPVGSIHYNDDERVYYSFKHMINDLAMGKAQGKNMLVLACPSAVAICEERDRIRRLAAPYRNCACQASMMDDQHRVCLCVAMVSLTVMVEAEVLASIIWGNNPSCEINDSCVHQWHGKRSRDEMALLTDMILLLSRCSGSIRCFGEWCSHVIINGSTLSLANIE
jgi:hypothetical protein